VDSLNPAYSSENGVLFDKSQTTLIQCPGGKAGSYTIPNSVNTIGDIAFDGCTSLTNVTIGTNVTNIGDWAFQYCTNLTSVAIGTNVTRIGNYAFYYCSSLINVTIPNSVTGIGNYAFVGCSSLTSIAIPAGVTTIGDFAFFYCASLTAITVDALNPAYSSVDGVLLYNHTMLNQCPAGKAGSYTIPNTVTYIGDNAFYHCSSLTNVTIPNTVTYIDDAAFAQCSSLTSITIPDSVTYIGGDRFPGGAFAGCSSLTALYFRGNAPSVGPDPFAYDNNATVYYLPGTVGWDTSFGDRPTALWFLPNPLILTIGPSFGVKTNQFGFIISWATNIPVAVEASTTSANPTWIPLATNTLTGGSAYFSDPRWTNYPARFYRLRSP
jgi:hypothetical protein